MPHPTSNPPPSEPAALAVDGVTKRFGPTTALDGLAIETAPAELVALVGPSGCGKSTLLRVVAGLAPADVGRVEIGGRLVDDGRRRVPPEQRNVGFVFQEHALFPHLRVADNVAFGIRHRSRSEVGRLVDEFLALVNLGDMGDRFPHELSGGERQRVALARALAPRPRLLLLDEPFASLDPNLRTRLRRDVIAALRATGTAALFVTHDQAEALAVGDRVAVMRAGRVEQIGDPSTVFHRPRNRFVAGFMGDAAFLPFEWDGGVARTVLGPLDLPTTARDDLVAMVRPDDVTFTVDPAGDVTIVDAEFRGSTWQYTLRLADGSTALATGSHLAPHAVGGSGRAELTPGHRQVVVADEHR